MDPEAEQEDPGVDEQHDMADYDQEADGSDQDDYGGGGGGGGCGGGEGGEAEVPEKNYFNSDELFS